MSILIPVESNSPRLIQVVRAEGDDGVMLVCVFSRADIAAAFALQFAIEHGGHCRTFQCVIDDPYALACMTPEGSC